PHYKQTIHNQHWSIERIGKINKNQYRRATVRRDDHFGARRTTINRSDSFHVYLLFTNTIMENLSKLRFKRDIFKTQLSRLKTYFDTIDQNNLTSLVITELECRLNINEGIYEQFNEKQSDIEFILENSESSNLEQLSSELQERLTFENLYFQLIASIKNTIAIYYNKIQSNNINDYASQAGNIQGSAVSMQSSAVSTAPGNVKLPTIKMPTFNGSYDRWLEFRDAFMALVHDNNTLSSIQKFYYLQSALEGEAARLIQAFEVSAANYAIAWDLLKQRFENKKLLVHNYIQAIFDAPTIIKESHIELRKLFDNFTKNIRSLETLGLPTKEWDALLIYILTSKFDHVTRRDWESFKIEGELPTIDDINLFLREKCELLEKLNLNKKENKFQKTIKCHSSTVSKADSKKYSCYYCRGEHAIYQCSDFIKLDIDSRIKEASRLNLCHNCLSPGHTKMQCKKSSCRQCNKKHNSMLHVQPEASGEIQQNNNNSNNNQPVAPAAVVGHTINNSVSQMLLSTAVVNVKDNKGNIQSARVLLDQGSQSNFITDNLCNKLGLKKRPVDFSISGVGQIVSEANYITSLTIMSRLNNFKINISCLVLPKITERLPLQSFEYSLINIPDNIPLADPGFNITGDIDILLGVGEFYKVISMRQICNRNQPVLQKTKLGWVVGGNLSCDSEYNKLVSCHTVSLDQIDDTLMKFWKLDECDTSLKFSSESDQFCESHFSRNFSRDIRCLYQLGLDSKEKFPIASRVILHDFYIDDLLSGSESPNELLQIQRDVTSILASGGFELRKWLSNLPELTNQFLLNPDLDSNILQLGDSENNKTLGILWNSNQDTIQYHIKNISISKYVSKRAILSITAQIFDPLGLLGPIVVVAKLIIQLLWQAKLMWDEPVPRNILNNWNSFCNDITVLNDLSLPRHVLIPNAENIEMHAFADASEKAYGACIYLRCKTANLYTTRLLCAKSRIAPLKSVTLPRLELCAALLLAQLVTKAAKSYSILSKIYFKLKDKEGRSTIRSINCRRIK
ncbi:hypothetical protein NQ317_002553, partial [Molorchus minor]